MKRTNAYHVALTGMLFALALVLSVLESWITPLLGLAPGVKIGLANIVVMYALLCMNRRQALVLVVLKAGFALLTRGAVAALLSGCGGLVSRGVMCLLLLGKQRPTLFILSAAGAIAHNVGQLCMAAVLLGSGLALSYAPVLLVSGLVVGWLTGTLLRALLPSMQKALWKDQ